MTSKLRLGVATGLALAATGVVLTATSASSGPAGTEDGGSGEVLRLVAKEVSSQFLDLGAADFSEGDQFVFTNDLFRGDTKVGEDGGLCIVTRLTQEGAATSSATASTRCPGGQITVQGMVTYGPDRGDQAGAVPLRHHRRHRQIPEGARHGPHQGGQPRGGPPHLPDPRLIRKVGR